MAIATHPVLLFIPLDDRPVCLDMVVELARAAGVEVRTPELSLLGSRTTPGDALAIWTWLDTQLASAPPAALIASVEMLCFGGLVASRQSEASFEEIAPALHRLLAVATRVPAFVSAVIPRTPVQPTDEDASHWSSADREALHRHRRRHQRLNGELIAAAARGRLRYLLIGQDDTVPGGLGQLEWERLQDEAAHLRATNVLLTTGADELNARLLARWLNDLTGQSPSVQVVYTYPSSSDAVPRYEARPLSTTVAEHLASAGCVRAEDDAEVILWVHNFEDRQLEASDQAGTLDNDVLAPILSAARAAALEERIVALADVRFANGGDRRLVERVLAEPRCAGIVAYAGWNTCSNSVGSCVAQAVVAYHLRASNLPGYDRGYRPAFFRRFLDDWGYQSVVRPRLSAWLAERGGQASDLSAREAEAEAFALAALTAEAVPALHRAFPYQPVTLQRISFPWHRVFEVHLAFEVKRWGKIAPRGNEVVDYDPRWPQMYEADRAAIQRALGPMLRGIEHVGSTAVPGLAAKPIIDIMLGVDVDDLDEVIEPLIRIGYEYNPDWEISMPLRRYFRRVLADGTNTHHLHAVQYGGEFWTRHVRFRDYLRAHPETAREYGALKRQIALQHTGSVDDTYAKTEFIRSVEVLAGATPPQLRHGRTP